MNSEHDDLLLRAEEALIAMLGGDPPNTAALLALLEDIGRYLEARDAERN